MGKFLAIAHNTFVQSLRQPITCILVLTAFLAMPLLLAGSGWTMGEGSGDYHSTDQKWFENMGLSMLLFLGALLAVFSASSALTREIEDHTALTVIAKPVSRSVFLLGKFAGVAAAVVVFYYLGTLAFLLTVRHQVISAASEPYDWPVIVLGLTALGLALLAAAGGNFFFSWPFPSAFIWCSVACLTVAMGVLLFVGKGWRPVPPGYDAAPQQYDVIRVRLPETAARDGNGRDDFAAWTKQQGYTILRWDFNRPVAYIQPDPNTTIPQGLAEVGRWKAQGVLDVGRQTDPPVIRPVLLAGLGLNFLSLLVLVAVAVAASTRLGLVLTLLVCLAVACAGAVHPYLTHLGGEEHNLSVRLLGWVVPNLTYFISMDVLSRPFETDFPAVFLFWATVYCALYVGAVLALGVVLFQRRQMAAESGGASVPGAVNLLAGLGRALALILGLVGLILLATPAMHTATRLLMAGALLVLALLTWFLWGYFGHGAKWAYWLVLIGAIADVIRVGLGWLLPKAGRYVGAGQEGTVPAALSGLLGAVVLLLLLLPKTRRHFQSH